MATYADECLKSRRPISLSTLWMFWLIQLCVKVTNQSKKHKSDDPKVFDVYALSAHIIDYALKI